MIVSKQLSKLGNKFCPCERTGNSPVAVCCRSLAKKLQGASAQRGTHRILHTAALRAALSSSSASRAAIYRASSSSAAAAAASNTSLGSFSCPGHSDEIGGEGSMIAFSKTGLTTPRKSSPQVCGEKMCPWMSRTLDSVCRADERIPGREEPIASDSPKKSGHHSFSQNP